jgi:hypothetical protein
MFLAVMVTGLKKKLFLVAGASYRLEVRGLVAGRHQPPQFDGLG